MATSIEIELDAGTEGSTVRLPSKLVPGREVAPRLGSLRPSFEAALALREAAVRALEKSSYDQAFERGDAKNRAAEEERLQRLLESEDRAFEAAARQVEAELQSGKGDAVALLLAKELLRTTSRYQREAADNTLLWYGVDPSRSVRSDDARCESAISAARRMEPLSGFLVECVDRRRFPRLEKGAPGRAALLAAVGEDAKLLELAPPEGRAALHTRRALRWAFVGDLEEAARAVRDALGSPPGALPLPRDIHLLAAKIAAEQRKDAVAFEHACIALRPHEKQLSELSYVRTGLDVALGAWIREGLSVDASCEGAPMVSAGLAIHELASGRALIARPYTLTASSDPVACRVARAATGDVAGCSQPMSALASAEAEGTGTGWLKREQRRLGTGPV